MVDNDVESDRLAGLKALNSQLFHTTKPLIEHFFLEILAVQVNELHPILGHGIPPDSY